VAISTPDPRRRRRSRNRVTLPRNLGGRRRVQPYSRVDAPYFRGPGFYVRVGGLAVVVAGALALLLLRAWSIQVLHGAKYAAEAHQQAYRTVDLAGARGAIVDAKGRLLAGTNGELVVTADAASLGSRDAHGRWNPSSAGLQELGRFARLAKASRHALVEHIKYSVLHAPLAPAVVLSNPSRGLADYLQERSDAFRAFKVEGQDTRSYPRGSLGGEFLGLLGQVTEGELKSHAYRNAQAGQLVGQTGVERAYDSILDPGFLKARVPVDSMGRIAGPLRIPKQKQPPTLQLSIDMRLQQATEKALLDGMADSRANHYSPTGASAVAIDPWTGAIKAIASYPGFDEKRAATKPQYFGRLLNDRSDPMLNRAIAGVYPTGSTFKPIIAEAALSAGLITPFTPQLCTGVFYLGNFPFHNVEAGINESMTLPTALEQSCDTWFYRLGDRIWAADPAAKATLIQRWARKLGLGKVPPIDLTGASAGYLPMPGSYFEKLAGTPYTEGQAINLSIGQGALQVSPLQLAVAYSALVNGGKVVRPHVGEAVIRDGVRHPLHFRPVRRLKLSPYTWAIKQGLYEAANYPQGTSFSVFNGFHPTVAGKTGTAEAPPLGVHSWYASFAPYRHPKLVVVVMIEHGGYGAMAAAPAAKEIYQAYFHGK
jgi:penicillin-binding protein 2